MPPNREEEFLPRAAFASAVTSSQLLGVGVMAMVGVWLAVYRGGFAWDGTEQQFNYHPLFMIIGMVFLNAEGITMLTIVCWVAFARNVSMAKLCVGILVYIRFQF